MNEIIYNTLEEYDKKPALLRKGLKSLQVTRVRKGLREGFLRVKVFSICSLYVLIQGNAKKPSFGSKGLNNKLKKPYFKGLNFLSKGFLS